MYTEKRNPFFEVEKMPIYYGNKEVPNKVALVNKDTGSFLGVVSSGYEVVTNSQVNELFENAVKKLGTNVKSVVDHLDANTVRWKRIFTLNEPRLEIRKGDFVNPTITIHNGFNGRISYGYNVGGMRKVCTNGLVLEAKIFTERYFHFVYNENAIAESFQRRLDLFVKQNEVFKSWSEEKYDSDDFALFLEDKKYLPPMLKNTLTEHGENILVNVNANKWEAYNLITAYMTHKTAAKSGSNHFSRGFNITSKLAADFHSTYGVH